jgi:hypothetical protein
MVAPALAGTHDFSLVLGGPLYQMFRRAHLSGPALEQLGRRIWVLTLLAWLPLLLLTIATGKAWGPPSSLPFLRDIEAQVRFLVAVPMLVAAELIVHRRTRSTVAQFLDRGLVRPQDVPRYDGAIASALRLRDSVPLELALLLLVATVGHWLWRSTIAFGAPSWYAAPENGGMRLTAAGVWFAAVSVPVFQFLLLRWYLRLLIWFRFLWQVSRLDLHLVPTHPDRTAGLAFLGKGSYAFGPILFAQGAVLAGLIATRVVYGGQPLIGFKLDVIGLVGFMVFFLLGPLTMFTPGLARAKLAGLAQYGKLASAYVTAFEGKWIRREPPDGELLGTGDIQSLSDLGQSYSVVREMNVLPFGMQDVGRLVFATAAPLLPLGLTVFSLEELVVRLVKIVF